MAILPLADAVKRIDAKTPVGSLLRSADWERVPVALRERAQFSAGVTSARVLQTIQDRLSGQINQQREELANGKQATFDRSSFIDAVRDIARDEGLTPANDTQRGGLTDITSIPRLGLIYDTQNQMATGYARWKMDQSEGALLLWPAWEFMRMEDRRVPREEKDPGFWDRRWVAAAGAAGDTEAVRVLRETGRKVALKTSGIWSKLSRFGTPWMPFDWGSGMGTEDVDREDAVELGLIAKDEIPEPSGEKDFNEELQSSVQGVGSELQSFLKESFGNQVEVAGGVASWKSSIPQTKEVQVSQSELIIPSRPQTESSTSFQSKLEAAQFQREIVVAAGKWIGRANDAMASASIKATDEGAHYNLKSKTLFINRDPKTWSGHEITLHHEAGHHIHTELGLITSGSVNAEFKNAMTRDWDAWRKMAKAKYGTEWRTKFKARKEQTRVEIGKLSGLTEGAPVDDMTIRKRVGRYSDTVLGLSGGAYGTGHSVAYMQAGNNAAMEVFAHAFSAVQTGDQVFQSAFPHVTAFVRNQLKL